MCGSTGGWHAHERRTCNPVTVAGPQRGNGHRSVARYRLLYGRVAVVAIKKLIIAGNVTPLTLIFRCTV